MATYNIVLTNAPAFYYQTVGSPGFTSVAIPTGAIKTTDRPRHVEYKRRHYIVGSLTKNLTFIESNQSLVITGITAPASVPTIATGAAGSPTGTMIGYISFRHKIGTTVIHESSLSAATNTISCTSQKVEWTSIPGSSPDARVTHVVLYRSVDGADPREVVELSLGTTTYSDNIATSALGGVGLTNNDPPPQARFIFLYHDRAWYVSVANPERTYFSEIGAPEAVGSASYISTRDGETVTGLNKVLDQLVVFGRRCTYDIQGYTVDDFNMRKVHPAVGCISNDAAVNISERLFFPAEDGVWIFDGSGFTYTMDEISSFWRDDYIANVIRYNNLVGANDRKHSVYRLLLKKPTSPRSFYYIGSYDNIDRGKPVQWTFDIRAREDNTIGEMDAGNGQLESYTGSCDGKIRKENVDTDADDDGDSYAKAFDLLLRTDNFEEVAAGSTTAKTFKDVNVYLRSESNSWTLKLWAGEEDATDRSSPSLSITTAASALSGYIGKNAHNFRPLGVSGLCLAPEITATSPLSMKWRGWDVTWTEGPSSRGRSS
jgi:hypothetical protein